MNGDRNEVVATIFTWWYALQMQAGRIEAGSADALGDACDRELFAVAVRQLLRAVWEALPALPSEARSSFGDIARAFVEATSDPGPSSSLDLEVSHEEPEGPVRFPLHVPRVDVASVVRRLDDIVPPLLRLLGSNQG